MSLLIVNFHHIGDPPPHAGIHPVAPAALEAQIRLLGAAFRFVSLDALERALDGAPLPSRACLLTFDDGLRSQFDRALPILDLLGVPAAFFPNTAPLVEQRASATHKVHWLRSYVPPDLLEIDLRGIASGLGVEPGLDDVSLDDASRQYRYDPPGDRRLKFWLNFALAPAAREAVVGEAFRRRVDDEAAFAAALYMDRPRLRALAARRWLGTHGHRHRPLAALPSEEAQSDLEESIGILRETAAADVFAVSYPFGGPDAVSIEVARVAAAAGLRLGFTMERALNTALIEPLLIARADTNDAPGGRATRLEVGADGSLLFRNGFAPSRTVWIRETP